jgi:hypothetical protein
VSGRHASTAPKVCGVDEIVLERGDEDLGFRRHPLMVVPLERGSDLGHPTLEVEVVSRGDFVAHHEVAVRPALPAAEPQIPLAVVERLRFDRHD